MFQPIRSSLASKQKTLEQSVEKEQKIPLSVKQFLKENYPTTARATVSYQSDSRTVYITPSQRSSVDVLLLNTKDIRAHLRADHIAIGKIVVLPPPNL